MPASSSEWSADPSEPCPPSVCRQAGLRVPRPAGARTRRALQVPLRHRRAGAGGVQRGLPAAGLGAAPLLARRPLVAPAAPLPPPAGAEVVPARARGHHHPAHVATALTSLFPARFRPPFLSPAPLASAQRRRSSEAREGSLNERRRRCSLQRHRDATRRPTGWRLAD